MTSHDNFIFIVVCFARSPYYCTDNINHLMIFFETWDFIKDLSISHPIKRVEDVHVKALLLMPVRN